MRYGEGLLEEIRRRTDLVQLVGRRVKLIRKGRVMWGCCPFHAEKSPSFKVENERKLYKCFGCGKGGDCFKWLIETDGLSFPEAVEKLAAEVGVELPKWSPEDEAREQKRKSLYDIVELAAKFYEDQLLAPAGREAREYLKGRGLDGAAARQFRLGYSPGGNGALIAHLTGHNVTQDDIIAAGLARPAEEGRPMRDFFYNRVMFTITDGRGRPIAFGARALEADAKPKYINSGENALFSKGQNLYNFAGARAAAIKTGTIIVAEGYTDVIAMVRAGFEHAVAPLGTALTEDQLHLLWRTAPEPILAFDGDNAGLKAAHRAAHLALPHLKPGHSLRFAFLPSGEDPDSFIAHNGAGAMRSLLNQAITLSELLWRSETEGKDFSSPERIAGLEHGLKEISDKITDAKVKEYYRRSFSEQIFEVFKAPKQSSAKRWEKNNSTKKVMLAPPSMALKATEMVPHVPKNPVTVPRKEPDSRVTLRRAASPSAPPSTGGSVRADNRVNVVAIKKVREKEIGRYLVADPAIAIRHAEILADLDFQDPQLDSLRRELLNLAASGSSLEKAGVQTHFARKGMDELLQRFAPRALHPETIAQTAFSEPDVDLDNGFLNAAKDLRELAARPSGRVA